MSTRPALPAPIDACLATLSGPGIAEAHRRHCPASGAADAAVARHLGPALAALAPSPPPADNHAFAALAPSPPPDDHAFAVLAATPGTRSRPSWPTEVERVLSGQSRPVTAVTRSRRPNQAR